MYICNQIKFGYLLSPLDDTQTIEDDYAQLTNIMLEASGKRFLCLTRWERLLLCHGILFYSSGLSYDVSSPTADGICDATCQNHSWLWWNFPHQFGTPSGASTAHGMVPKSAGPQTQIDPRRRRKVRLFLSYSVILFKNKKKSKPVNGS